MVSSGRADNCAVASLNSPMPIAPVLQRFVNEELARMPALIERTRAGTLALMRDTRQGPLTEAERASQFVIVEALQSHGAAYDRAFIQAVKNGVQDFLDQHRDAAPSGQKVAFGGLELMDESRIEVDIEISRAMQLIDSTAEWELRELQTFTSSLVGQTYVSAESNPFRPALFAGALWEAACAVSPVPVRRAAVLRISAGVAAGLLKSAWAAASTRLEAQGVDPSIYRSVLLAPGTTIDRASPVTDSTKIGAMASLLAGMPSGSPDMKVSVSNAASPMGSSGRLRPATTTPSPEFQQALARLDELMRHAPIQDGSQRDSTDSLLKRLNLHRAVLIASAGAPLERQIIELLSRIFDAILSDPQVPPAFVSTLARLQPAALRVALHDVDMLASTQHSVWRLVDRIGETSISYPHQSDARAIELLAFCDELVTQLSRSDSLHEALYRRALVQLEDFLAEQLQAQVRAAHATVLSLQVAERRDVLEQRLALKLTDQMMPVRASATLRGFVTVTWAKVVAQSMLRFGENAEVTHSYLKLVDELLWSLKLPDHPQSRQRLVALLPGMLKRLRAGMDLIGVQAVDQQIVLDELMVVHTDALRPTRGAAPELTSDQLVQRMRDEVLPASTGHGAFSDSVIDLASMQTVPAELMPSDGPPVRLLKGVEVLQEADRLRLFLRGRWARVQLLWRSEQRLFYLFAGETPARTYSVTYRALERLNSAGLMQPLENRSLLERALDTVTRELARPS
jgi:hypothetical protein